MIPFKTEHHSFDVPTCWEDVTYRQFADLDKHKENLADTCVLLSCLTGLTYKECYEMNEKDILGQIVPRLTFLNEQLNPDELPMPDFIYHQGKSIGIPTNIKQKTFGQKIVLQTLLKKRIDANEPAVNLLPLCMAVYLAPEYYNEEFDGAKVSGFEKLVWDMPALKVYPIGSFFLRASMKLLKRKIKPFNSGVRTNSYKRALIN